MIVELKKKDGGIDALESVVGFGLNEGGATITFEDETFLSLEIKNGEAKDYKGNVFVSMKTIQEIKF